MKSKNPETAGLLTISKKERECLWGMRELASGRMSKKALAALLGITRQHVHRLYKKWLRHGDAALMSGHRGRRGNNRKDEERGDFMKWYQGLSPEGRYAPSHAAQVFERETGMRVSKESVRRWLSSAGLWSARSAPAPNPHQLRERRSRRGELVQIDGSDHHWLGGHRFVLLQFVDDATSELLHAVFVQSENTADYLRAFHDYTRRHGVPLAVYTDRHSVFHNNSDRERLTQWGRMLHELDVRHIASLSPQSRGRVEPAHHTAQMRLTKELANHCRHMTIGSQRQAIAAANRYLGRWIDDYNRRYAKPPPSADDAHRPLRLDDEQMLTVFSQHERRRLTADCHFSFQGKRHVVVNHHEIGNWRGNHAEIDILLHFTGNISFRFKDRPLQCKIIGKDNRKSTPSADGRQLNHTLDNLLDNRKKPYKPPMSHPWKAPSFEAQMRKNKKT